MTNVYVEFHFSTWERSKITSLPRQKYLNKNNHLTSAIDKVTNVLLNLSVAPLVLNFVSRYESESSTKFLKIASKEL